MVKIAIMNFHEFMVCDILATLNALVMIDLEVAGTAEIPPFWIGLATMFPRKFPELTIF